MDATCECLSDHGIAPDDLIEILVSYRQGTDVNSGPRAPVSPMRGRSRTTTPPRTRYSNRNGERGDQNSELAQEKGITKSQNKIKQTFKCPRFSGNAKDWKLWNKGFQRYLSIWDLEYVLLPEFFNKLPLSPQQVTINWFISSWKMQHKRHPWHLRICVKLLKRMDSRRIIHCTTVLFSQRRPLQLYF